MQDITCNISIQHTIDIYILLASHTTTGYQLMTLSRDRTLRVWPISGQLSSMLGAAPIEIEGSNHRVSSMESSFSSHMELESTLSDIQVKNNTYIIACIDYDFPKNRSLFLPPCLLSRHQLVSPSSLPSSLILPHHLLQCHETNQAVVQPVSSQHRLHRN